MNISYFVYSLAVCNLIYPCTKKILLIWRIYHIVEMKNQFWRSLAIFSTKEKAARAKPLYLTNFSSEAIRCAFCAFLVVPTVVVFFDRCLMCIRSFFLCIVLLYRQTDGMSGNMLRWKKTKTCKNLHFYCEKINSHFFRKSVPNLIKIWIPNML